MALTFELIGVAPMLDFFTHQQEREQRKPQSGAEYLGSHKCTLDAFINSVEVVLPKRGWEMDQAVDTVVNFWLTNIEAVQHWKQRLEDAGTQSLVVGRLADIKALQTEFEHLFG